MELLQLHCHGPAVLLRNIEKVEKSSKAVGGSEEDGKLNLKETMMPLVGFGRIYSLHQ